LQRTGLTAAIGEQHLFPTVRAGVRAYEEASLGVTRVNSGGG